MMLEIAGISFGYVSENVISDVTFSADPGDVVSIIGPNGVGKTTLLKCINNIHPPCNGVVMVDGEDVLGMKPNDVAKTVGYVPQRAHVSGSTVFESVLLGCKPHMGLNVSEKDLRLTGRIIEIMGLTGISQKHVNEVSGGEYQLVQIARALAQQPKILVMDEPTSNLDLGNQGLVMKTVSGIVRDNAMCAVMVNHDINLALRYSNRFIMMSGGRIYDAGGKEIITPESIHAVYGIDAAIREFDGISVVIPR